MHPTRCGYSQSASLASWGNPHYTNIHLMSDTWLI
jgi:hypothetical protein